MNHTAFNIYAVRRFTFIGFVLLIISFTLLSKPTRSQDNPTPTEVPTNTELPTDLPTATEPLAPTLTETPLPTEIPMDTPTFTEIPTLTETLTETPTFDSTETPAAESTETPTSDGGETPVETLTETETLPVSPTAPATSTEIPMSLLVSDNFDSGDLSNWTLGNGWLLVPSESGQALQVNGSDEPATFVQNNLGDAAVQMRFIMNIGAVRLSLRQSEVGTYTVTIDMSGSISLYHDTHLLGSAVVNPITLGEWRTLRLSAVDDVIRVAIDGVEVIAVQDTAPLPPGTISFGGLGLSEGALRVDNVSLWISTKSLPPVLTLSTTNTILTPTSSPTARQPINQGVGGIVSLQQSAILQNGDVNTLKEQINACNNSGTPKTIDLAEGVTYTLTDPIDPEISITNTDSPHFGRNGLPIITCTLTINGHGATIVRGTSSITPTSALTTTPIAPNPNDFRIFNVYNGGNLTLNNLTIENGSATGTGGSGILVVCLNGENCSTVTLNNVTVKNNIFDQYTIQHVLGAGIYNYNSNLYIHNSYIVGNRNGIYLLPNPMVRRDGGGIAVLNGNIQIDNTTTITGNSALEYGGAVYVETLDGLTPNVPVMTNSCIIANSSIAVSSNSSSLKFTDNWWGQATGPIINTDINSGGGDTTSYLTAEPPGCAVYPTLTPTPSNTPTPSDTPTFTLTPTDTPTNTPTPSDTPTFTLTPTDTPTNTLTPTPTATPSGPPSASQSSIVLNPMGGIAAANGQSPITLTITVKQADGQILTNWPVELSSTNSTLVFSASSGQTDSNGVFTTQVTSTSITTGTIKIDAGAVTLGNPIVQFIGADPTVSVMGPAMIVAGQYLVYAVKVSNLGLLSAKNITVASGLPLGSTSFVSAPPPPSGVQPLEQSGNQVNWLIAELLPNNTRTMLIVAKSATNLTLNTQLVFGAQVSATVDSNHSNDQTTITTKIVASQNPNGLNQPTKLAVAFTASSPTAQVGDSVNLQVTVTNNTTNETLYNVQAFSGLKGLIPDLVLSWPDPSHPGMLLPQETATASFVSTILPNFALQNFARAKALDSDPSDGNSDVSNSAPLSNFQVNGPGLTTVVNSNTNNTLIGGTVTFTVQVTNNSLRNDAADNLVVHDSITGGNYSLNPSGPLLPGQTASVSFTYMAQASDVPQIVNQISVSGNGVSYPSIQVTTSTRITVSVQGAQAADAANLKLDTSSLPVVLLSGQTAHLPILLANDGTQSASNVTFSMTLPLEVELVDIGAGGDSSSYDTNTRRITWTWTALNASSGTGISPVIRAVAQPGATALIDISTATTSAETQFSDNATTLLLPIVAQTASHSTITAITRDYIVADGQDTIQLKLMARDPLDVPLPNLSTILSADMSGVALAPVTLITDANGEATFSLQATEVGPVTITASFSDGASTSFTLQRRPSAVQLEHDTLNVGVGGLGTLNLSVLNTTASGDNFTLHVSGLEALDPQWYYFSPTALSLGSGQFNKANLTIAVPNGECAAAGTYPITITAKGNTVGNVGQAQATVTISPAPPALTRLYPASGAHVGSSNVIFTWRSNTPGTSTIYWRAESDQNYTAQAVTINPTDPTLYSASIPLPQGSYVWYASTTTGCGTTTTNTQTFTVTQSVSFVSRSYTFTIPDDYNITHDINGAPLTIRVANNDNVPRQVTVSTDNPYADLILGFTGSGSLNQAATIPPGSILSLTLRVYTQETMQDQYAITLTLQSSDGATDSIPLTLTINRPAPDIRIENFSTDPTTLVTSATVTNYGGVPVTDLNFDVVQISSGIPANFIVQPDLHHVYLPAGSRVSIRIIPLEISDNQAAMNTSSISSTTLTSGITLTSTQQKTFDPYTTMLQVPGPFQGRICSGDLPCDLIDLAQVVNQCLSTYVHTTCNGDGTYLRQAEGTYCTNRPNIDIALLLPDFGSANVSGASLSASFSPGEVGVPYSHATSLSINGVEVANGIVPDQSTLSGLVPPEALLNRWQTLNLRSVHPYGNQAHYTVAGNFTLSAQVTNFVRDLCVKPAELTANMLCPGVAGFYQPVLQAQPKETVCESPISGANIRATPETNGAILAPLYQGTVSIVGYYQNDSGEYWIYVYYQIDTTHPYDGHGWLSGILFSNTPQVCGANKTVPPYNSSGNPTTPPTPTLTLTPTLTPTPNVTPTPYPTVTPGAPTSPPVTLCTVSPDWVKNLCNQGWSYLPDDKRSALSALLQNNQIQTDFISLDTWWLQNVGWGITDVPPVNWQADSLAQCANYANQGGCASIVQDASYLFENISRIGVDTNDAGNGQTLGNDYGNQQLGFLPVGDRTPIPSSGSQNWYTGYLWGSVQTAGDPANKTNYGDFACRVNRFGAILSGFDDWADACWVCQDIPTELYKRALYDLKTKIEASDARLAGIYGNTNVLSRYVPSVADFFKISLNGGSSEEYRIGEMAFLYDPTQSNPNNQYLAYPHVGIVVRGSTSASFAQLLDQVLVAQISYSSQGYFRSTFVPQIPPMTPLSPDGYIGRYEVITLRTYLSKHLNNLGQQIPFPSDDNAWINVANTYLAHMGPSDIIAAR